MSTQTHFSRRQLGLMGLGAACSLASCAGNNKASTQIRSSEDRFPIPDLTKPEVNLNLFTKMLGTVDSSPVIYWYQSIVYAILPGKSAVALMRFEGFSHARFFVRENGNIDLALKDLAVYMDLDSRKPLEEFKNPLNDLVGKPKHHFQDPASLTLTTMGARIAGRDLPLKSAPFVLPWTLIGDDVIVDLNYELSYDNPISSEDSLRYSGPVISTSEFLSYKAKAKDIFNPATASARSYGNWQGIKPWEPWLHMGTTPGWMLTRANSLKLSHIEELPKHLLDYASKHYPQMLTAPETWTGDTSFRPSYFEDKAP